MPDSPEHPRRPGRPTTPGEGLHEHDSFVVDTRRSKGNRRATAPRRRPADKTPSSAGDTPRPIPTRSGDRAPRPTSHNTDIQRVESPDGDVYIGGRGRHEGGSPARSGTDAGRRPASRGAAPGGPVGPRDHGAHPRTPGGGEGGSETPRERRRLSSRGKKVIAGLLVFLLLWVGGLIWAGTSAWDKVTKVDAIPSQHLADSGDGTNTLIVGSDGRAGLTTAQRKALGTGQAEGQRTDSIMVLHTGGPKPTLMSIPRDSYVSIPGHAKNKINASFSLGGPQLLIKTIEQNTGIHIDDYMEIGFGGFASVVDAVGGVNICVARDMNDHKAHINLKKGCQTLNGANALGYVRARYSDPEGDIGRAKRQRQFLGALMKKISSPSNLLVPWKLKGLGESGAQGLSVDKGMSMFHAMSIMWTLKGFSSNKGNSVVVPVGDEALPTPAGEAIAWDPTRSAALFKAIRDNGDTSPYITKTTN